MRAAGKWWIVALTFLPAILASNGARAIEPAQPKYGWREMWVGGDAMRDVWLLYTGVTLAPWSEHVYDPGFRLRAHSGYGEFDYELASGPIHERFTGTVSYADALVGYHWRLGELDGQGLRRHRSHRQKRRNQCRPQRPFPP